MYISLTNTIGAIRTAIGIVRKNLQLWLDFEKSEWVGGELVVKDKSPNTNNAKLFTGKALSFDGTGDYVATDFIPNKTEGTISTWFKLDSLKNYNTIFDNAANVNEWECWVYDTGQLRFKVNGSNGDVSITGLTTDVWYRMVLTWSEVDGTKLYLNNSSPSIGSSGTYSQPSTLSLGGEFNSRLDGLLSDFQIYDKQWTASDVAFDYNNPNHLAIDNPATSLVVTDLKGYWALSEGDGLVAYDSSGEGNNGTINGATYTPAKDTIPQLGMMDWAKGSNLEPTSNSGTYGSSPASEILTQSPLQSNTAIIPVPNTTSNRYQYDFAGGAYSSGQVLTYSWYSKQITTPLGSYVGNLYFNTFVNCTIVTAAQEIESDINGWDRFSMSFSIDDGSLASIMRPYFGSIIGVGNQSVAYWGHQLEESSSAGNYILTDGGAAIDVTTIQNPTNKGFDILGNALRLREHAFNLDGSGYAEVADSDSLDVNEGFSVSFWRKLDVSTDGVRSALVTKGVGLSTGTDYGVALSMYQNKIIGDVNTDLGRTFVQKLLTIDGSWVFVTFTYTKNEKSRLYIDTDAPVESTTISGTINETHPIRVGTDKDLGFKDSTLIDEVVWYDRPLTQKEITQNYNIGINKHKATSSFSDDFSSDYGI